MKPIKSPQSLTIIRKAYNGNGNEKVSRNFHLRKEQDDMLDALADHYQETKVTVLKAIIDEWREMRLRGCEQE